MDHPTIHEAIQQAIKTKEQTIIGVVGVPGAGKTYFCNHILKDLYPHIKIIPMDGYHIYRSELSEEGIIRRGAPFTFNSIRFRSDIEYLKKTGVGKFPQFEHSVKDPVEDQIIINQQDYLIVVEGLYLFLKDWEMSNLFDIKILIDKPLDQMRLAQRHLDSGLVGTLEEGLLRVQQNDQPNGEYLLKNSNFDNILIYN